MNIGARDALLAKEIELRRAMEAVAAARRELPPEGRPTDWHEQLEYGVKEPAHVG